MPLLWEWLWKVWDYIVQSEDAATVILGLVGLGLLWWRSRSSERQATAAQAQVHLAQLDSLYDRYRKGADMLGDDTMSTRLGGIYSLRRLAEEHPDEFHLQVMEILCAFIRTPPSAKRTDQEEPLVPVPKPREDMQAALEAVIYRRDRGIEIEKATETDPDRSRWFQINLLGAVLERSNLQDAKLRGATLSHVRFRFTNGKDTNLSDATMIRVVFDYYTSFIGANFEHANMSEAEINWGDFTNAELNGVDLSGARFGSRKPDLVKVTQCQLDTAIANPEFPPDIPEGLTDFETGKPIVWNHELCGDRWIEKQKIPKPEQDTTDIGPKGLRSFRHWFAR